METLFTLNPISAYKTEQIIEDENSVPKIQIKADTYAKIKNVISMSPLEVGWLSHVTISKNTYTIDSCEIVEQKVMSAETEMTTQGLQNFMQDTIKNKGVKYFNDIRCWGHSHVNMSVNPSGQDSKQIMAWKESNYEIMLIMNKRDDIYSALYDFANNKKYIGLPVSIVFDGFDEKQRKEISKELKSKVEEKKWEPMSHFYSMQSGKNFGSRIGDPFFVSDEKESMENVSKFLRQESMLEDSDFYEEDFGGSPSAVALAANRIHTILTKCTTNTPTGYTMGIDNLCIVMQELTDCLFHFEDVDLLVTDGAIRCVAAMLFASIKTIAYPKEMSAMKGWLSLEAPELKSPEIEFDLDAVCEWVGRHLTQSDAQILYSILDRELSFENFANLVETFI